MGQIKGKFKFLLALRLMIWFVGFPAGVVAFIAVLLPQDIPLIARILLLPGTLTWIASYQIGLLYNAKLLGTKERIGHHILTLFFTPLFGLMETAPAFFFYLFRYKGFYVVKKDLVRKAEIRPPEAKVVPVRDDTSLMIVLSLALLYYGLVLMMVLPLLWYLI